MESAISSRGPSSRALWGRAFRPFFLGLALQGALVVPFWACVWLAAVPAPSWLVPIWWHGHEMVFGFIAAAIAGFLLTASPVWSGGPALVGRPLAALFALWVLGRIAFVSAGLLPAGVVALVDVAFLPLVAGVVVRTLRGSGQMHNYGVAGIVAVLALANAAMHAEALGWTSGLAPRALRFAVDVVALLLVVISGRITPAFTRNGLRMAGSEAVVVVRPQLAQATIGLVASMALVRLVLGPGVASGTLSGLAGLGMLVQLVGWRSWAVRRDPLLWSLHAGAAWLGVGLLLVGCSDAGLFRLAPSAGLHALTAGAMGSSILAVITRVSLGHTGRPLVLPSGIVACYALVHLAALLRVVASLSGGFSGAAYHALLVTSALAWGLAFLGFLVRYTGILIQPRPDGRLG